MLFRLLIFTLILVGVCTEVAFAQEPTPLQNSSAFYDYSAGPIYRQMARDALGLRPPDFDFTKFRGLYASQPGYDPVGEITRSFLLEKAYYIERENDDALRQKMLDDYAAMVMAHLANIDAVTQALALSRHDPRFGDPLFYDWVREGLRASVLNSGTGESLGRAYEIVCMGEESLLLNALGVKHVQTLSRESGGTHYNIHDVEVFKTGQKYPVFTNITIPMRFLAEQEQAKGFVMDLGNQ